MSECERCGRKGRLTLVKIDRAEMYVCPDCQKYGKKVEKSQDPPRSQTVNRTPMRPRPSRPDAMTRREKELADDYPRRIQRGREKLGLSREDLGRKINERVSVISNLEHGQMHPSDKLIKKLEKALDIELMEEVEDFNYSSGAESSGMTLADFIVVKKK